MMKRNSDIRMVTVTLDYPYLKKISEIYEEAFPPNERPSDISIDDFIKDKRNYLLAIEDDNDIVGFALLQDCGDGFLYLRFFAIAREFRGKEYGSIVLNLLKNVYYKEKYLFGVIEALLPETDNYEQRLLRRDFYVRNGWILRDRVIDAGYMGKYQVIYSKSDTDFGLLASKLRMLYPNL